MSRFKGGTVNITSEILILPGFQEGLSRRGAWFACTLSSKKFLHNIKKRNKYMLRYVVREPDSPTPLSDGEIFHLVNKISFSFDQYKSNLQRMEMQYADIRKRGKLNAFIYLLGILTVRWYWWIFLTRGEMSLYNHRNAINLHKVLRTENIEARIWDRGKNPQWVKILNRTWEHYDSLEGSGLEKYDNMIQWANGKSEEEGEYGKIAEAYSDIKRKFTGLSLFAEILPTTLVQRLAFFFNRSLPLPLPDNIHEIRNLSLHLENCIPMKEKKEEPLFNRVDGNAVELFLLASKSGDPVCVADREPLQLAGTLTRAGNMKSRGKELKVILHVGTEEERTALLSGRNRLALQIRILNAALDTIRQSETLICYYMKEYLPVRLRQFRTMYPFRSRLHGLFPWLFITNGIPVASILAVVWLFIDPYYDRKFLVNYDSYFSSILKTLNFSYRNLSVEVKLNRGLGEVNRLIKSGREKGFRDSILSLNRLALPVSLMDRVLFNNLTMETDQLRDSAREANNFTTIPGSLLYGEAGHDQ